MWHSRTKPCMESDHRLLRADLVAEHVGLEIEDKMDLVRADIDKASKPIDKKTIGMRLSRNVATDGAVAIELVQRLVND